MRKLPSEKKRNVRIQTWITLADKQRFDGLRQARIPVPTESNFLYEILLRSFQFGLTELEIPDLSKITEINRPPKFSVREAGETLHVSDAQPNVGGIYTEGSKRKSKSRQRGKNE